MALGNRRGIRWLFSGFLLLFSVVFLSGILWRYWPTLANYPWEFDLWPALIGCLVYTAALLVVVLVWSLLLKHLGASLDFREHLRIYCLTFFALRIPGAPWHVAGRVVLYRQRGIDASVASVAAGLELLLAIISGLVAGLLIWFVLPASMQRQLVWLVIVLIFALALIHPRVIRGVLKRLGYAEENIRLRYQDMLFFLLLYLIVWSMDGIVLYSITRTLYPIPFTLLPAVTGAWALSGAISLLAFISPSSLGLREIALSVLLGLFIPPALAVIIAILARLLLTATELLWAIVASRAQPLTLK
jgi:hypothetical protein